MKQNLDVRQGLSRDKRKGYKLKVTISRGGKLVGSRVQMWLHTQDEALAIVKRDAILEGYRRIGLTIVQSTQCKRPDFRPMPEPVDSSIPPNVERGEEG